MTEPAVDRLLVPVLLFVAAVVAVVSSLGAPLVPTIAEVHHVSVAAAQWSLTVSLLMAAVATPALGRLGDGPRRKQVLVGVLVAVVIGGVLAALPLGFAALLGGRALQGLGLGLAPLTIAIATEHLPPARAHSAVAMLSVTAAAGVGIGFPLTGLLTDVFGLPGAFWFGALTTGAAAVLAAWVVPPSPQAAPAALDVPGVLLLGSALAGLLVAISEAPSWGVTSGRLLLLVGVSFALLFAWVRHELRTPLPLVDVRLLRHRAALSAAVVGILTAIGFYLLLSLVTRFVQTPVSEGYGFGASVVVAGLVVLPFSLATVTGSRLVTLITPRGYPGRALPLGCTVCLVGTVGFALAHDALWQVVLAMAVTGLGVGCTFATLPWLILRTVPVSETGSAMGFNQVLRMTGFALGSALSAAVLRMYTETGEALPTEQGYVAAALLGAAVWILAVILGTVLPGPRTRCR